MVILYTVLFLATLIKKKIKFSSYMYQEIQSGAVAKSYMRKGFLYMRRKLVISDFATAPF